jgi:peptidoglycan-associated lipoprotein
MTMSIADTSMYQLALAATVAVALGAGCSSTPKPAPATQSTGSEFREVAPPQDSSDQVTEVGLEPSLQTVYFDFDKSAIREDAKPLLRSNADAIMGNRALGTITIEGHCDERGSEEYNLALGERRANSVRRYLVDLGVSRSRLDTVSFGESKPAVRGHDESAWRWNRRADFARAR